MPINLFEPRTLGKVVTRMPKPKTFLRDTFFRNPLTFPTKRVEVDFTKGNRKIAPFVHPKIGGKTVENTGYKTNIFEPALVAPDTITTADDLLKRMPGENLYSGISPDERAIKKVATDMEKLEAMITRREELMCAQAIFLGKIPVIGEGLNYEIDFDFTNKETLSGGDLWSTDTSDPIKKIKELHREVQKTGFVNCDVCIMAADVADRFIDHPKVKEKLDVRNYNLATISPKELPNGATYVGTIPELGLDIYQYNEWFLDDWTNPLKPEQKPLVPTGTIVLLSTNAEYSMAYGAVTLIDKDSENFYTVEASRVADSWIKKKPARRFLQLNSKPLPVPHEVDSWFVAKVL
ncbi:major capsid protein [Clostridium botulinum]|uniref:major capsid protein n=2 Tax=Clostridium botulinum TaxID=1491 RepID=UPI0007743F02|nr:major capsid protein [Clostridium botulinum]AUN08966.1 phage capsid protein [Clostridium botulinum]MBN3352636.1 major capsid protein [Clostridium botulinum]MBN3368370.1 major capsid protein [Clostridium botulinum]MBN3375874.1 major capsid protein [Clostridium botulinum]